MFTPLTHTHTTLYIFVLLPEPTIFTASYTRKASRKVGRWKDGLTDMWRIKIMRTTEKKGVFQTEIFRTRKIFNDEYLKFITDHFLPCLLLYSCIYIVPVWIPNRRHGPNIRTYCLPILLHLYWKYLATLWETQAVLLTFMKILKNFE